MRFYTIKKDDKELVAVETMQGRIIPLEKLGINVADMNELICRYDELKDFIQKERSNHLTEDITIDSVDVLAPITVPKQDVICLGVNYREHIEETVDVIDFTKKADTVYFSKRVNRCNDPGGVIPDYDFVDSLDYEVELGVILKKDALGISAKEASDYIFGYTIINDVSARNLQLKHQQWFRGKSLDMDEVVESYRSDLENDIEGRTIKFRKGIPQIVLNLIGFPVSVIPIHVTFMMSDRAGNIDHVKFHFEDKSCDMSWNEGPESNTVTCGMDGHYRYGQIRLGKIDFKVCCYAEWFDGTNLNVTIRPIETVGKRKLNFNFKSHTRVVMKPSSIPDTKDFANYMKGFAGDLIKNPALLAIVKKVVFFLPYIVEPKQRGKFID